MLSLVSAADEDRSAWIHRNTLESSELYADAGIDMYLPALLVNLHIFWLVCKGLAVPAQHEVMHQLVEATEGGFGE